MTDITAPTQVSPSENGQWTLSSGQILQPDQGNVVLCEGARFSVTNRGIENFVASRHHLLSEYHASAEYLNLLRQQAEDNAPVGMISSLLSSIGRTVNRTLGRNPPPRRTEIFRHAPPQLDLSGNLTPNATPPRTPVTPPSSSTPELQNPPPTSIPPPPPLRQQPPFALQLQLQQRRLRPLPANTESQAPPALLHTQNPGQNQPHQTQQQPAPADRPVPIPPPQVSNNSTNVQIAPLALTEANPTVGSAPVDPVPNADVGSVGNPNAPTRRFLTAEDIIQFKLTCVKVIRYYITEFFLHGNVRFIIGSTSVKGFVDLLNNLLMAYYMDLALKCDTDAFPWTPLTEEDAKNHFEEFTGKKAEYPAEAPVQANVQAQVSTPNTQQGPSAQQHNNAGQSYPVGVPNAGLFNQNGIADNGTHGATHNYNGPPPQYPARFNTSIPPPNVDYGRTASLPPLGRGRGDFRQGAERDRFDDRYGEYDRRGFGNTTPGQVNANDYFNNLTVSQKNLVTEQMLEKITPFDGTQPQKAHAYIETVEEVSHKCSLEPIVVAEMKLRGKADEVMKRKKQNYPNGIDWQSWKNEFLTELSDTPHLVDARAKYERIVQGEKESVKAYISRCTVLLARINGTGNLKEMSTVDHLAMIKGLRNHRFKKAVISKNLDACKNMQELIKKIDEVEQQFARRSRYEVDQPVSDEESRPASHDESTEADPNVDEVGYRRKYRPNQFNKGQRFDRSKRWDNSRKNYSKGQGKPKSDYSNLVCGFCGKKGHKIMQCRKMKAWKLIADAPKDKRIEELEKLDKAKGSVNEVDEQAQASQSDDDNADVDNWNQDYSSSEPEMSE